VRLFNLSEKLKAKASSSKSSGQSSEQGSDADLLSETLRLQGLIAQADRVFAVGSINGTKYTLQKIHGYGGAPRRPLPPITEKKGEELLNNEWVKALLEEEAKAEKLAKVSAA
jgi:L-threo-3-deoxy-hexylosonate aldolase